MTAPAHLTGAFRCQEGTDSYAQRAAGGADRRRRVRAGSTSLGHEWPEDGAVVEVLHHADQLLHIPDGGFSEVENEDDKPGVVDEAPRPGRRRRRDDTASE